MSPLWISAPFDSVSYRPRAVRRPAHPPRAESRTCRSAPTATPTRYQRSSSGGSEGGAGQSENPEPRRVATAFSAIGDRHMTPRKEGRSVRPRHRLEALQIRLRVLPLRALSAGELVGKGEGVRRSRWRLSRVREDPLPADRDREDPLRGQGDRGYLRLPIDVRPARLVLTIGGLDGRKENASFPQRRLPRSGVAYFSFDMPAPANRPSARSRRAPSANSRACSTTSPRARTSTPSAWSSTAALGRSLPRGSRTPSRALRRRSRQGGRCMNTSRPDGRKGPSRPRVSLRAVRIRAPRSTAPSPWTTSSPMARRCH